MINSINYSDNQPPLPQGEGWGEGNKTAICTYADPIHASYVDDKDYKSQRQPAPSPLGMPTWM